MVTSHLELQTGHTAAIFEEIPAMVCDASRSSKSQAKWSISLHRVAGLILHFAEIDWYDRII